MASEKQAQKKAELESTLALLWKKYDRAVLGRPRVGDPPIDELRREIRRHALYVYLNED